MKYLILVLSICSLFNTELIAQENHPENEIKITIIRKGSIAGSANKWKLWVNGEELCKIKNSSYCETIVKTNSLSFIGKAVGIGTAVAFQWALQKSKAFEFDNLDQPEYYFRAKLAAEKGLQFVEFTMIDIEEAKKLLKKAKRKSE